MSPTEWLTLVLVFVTAWYAWLTHSIAKSAAEQAWESGRAQVIATLSLHQAGQLLHLVIRNDGRGVARNCRLNVDQEVQSTLSVGPLRGTVAFKRPIAALPPGFEWHYALGQPHVYLDRTVSAHLPMIFTVETEYETGGRKVRESHVIDIEALLYGPAIRNDASQFYSDFPRKFENQMKDLTTSIKKVEATLKGLDARRKKPLSGPEI